MAGAAHGGAAARCGATRRAAVPFQRGRSAARRPLSLLFHLSGSGARVGVGARRDRLSALVLAFWLLYRQAFVQAVLAGVNLLAVARFTRLLSPQMALRITASRGDRAALRLLEAHDPAWAKIRAANRFSDLG